jgi:hypothetical protein
MALKLNYKQVTNQAEAFTKVKAFITPQYLEKFQIPIDLNFDEDKKIAKATGSGFSLVICFFEDYCDVDLDLSFLLKPLKLKILEKIQSQIERNL